MDRAVRTLPEHIRHVAVEGVIGAGKTTLCHLLKDAFNARLVLEAAEENPFLARFYQERNALAFQTQLWFLVSRYRQLSEALLQEDLFHPVVLADSMFAKDRIFASINLDEDELLLYDTVASALSRDVPRPDLVVFLQASTDVLLKRIARRGRVFEHGMDRHYLDALSEAYNHFFFHYTRSPVLIVNTNDSDFVESQGDLEELIRQICGAGNGVSYFHPVSKA